MAEIRFLGMVDHPNLVKLLGYCGEDHERGIQRLLVYEFMENGSLENHLFTNTTSPLTWKMRLDILLGTAQALAYLHEEIDGIQVCICILMHATMHIPLGCSRAYYQGYLLKQIQI